jgi:hypothetical protein
MEVSIHMVGILIMVIARGVKCLIKKEVNMRGDRGLVNIIKEISKYRNKKLIIFNNNKFCL